MVFVIFKSITKLGENENHIPIIQIGTVQRAPEKKLLPQGCWWDLNDAERNFSSLGTNYLGVPLAPLVAFCFLPLYVALECTNKPIASTNQKLRMLLGGTKAYSWGFPAVRWPIYLMLLLIWKVSWFMIFFVLLFENWTVATLKHGIWVCVPGPQSLIFGFRTNHIIFVFEVRTISYVSCT